MSNGEEKANVVGNGGRAILVVGGASTQVPQSARTLSSEVVHRTLCKAQVYNGLLRSGTEQSMGRGLCPGSWLTPSERWIAVL